MQLPDTYSLQGRGLWCSLSLAPSSYMKSGCFKSWDSFLVIYCLQSHRLPYIFLLRSYFFPFPPLWGTFSCRGSVQRVSEAVLWSSPEACFCIAASKHNPEKSLWSKKCLSLFGFEVLSPLFQNAVGSIYIPKLFCLERRELRKSREATHINNCVWNQLI